MVALAMAAAIEGRAETLTRQAHALVTVFKATSSQKESGIMKIGLIISVLLCCSLLNPGLMAGQQATPGAAQTNAAPQKYKLTVLESSSTSKRVKKGRVSSQAVVKVTDENDVPVPGIAVTFMLPQLSSGGAAFASGGLTSLVTTNAAGVASSGAFSAATGSSFSISVAASVPGGVLTGAVPISTAAAAAGAAGAAGAAAGAAGAAGISTAVIVGIAVAVVAGGIGAAVALKGGSSSTPTSTTTPGPTTTVGSVTSITFGHP
jgi:hypothetical protein